MEFRPLVCVELSPDRFVARFRLLGTGEPVFGYLPHVPGVNPYLLREGDQLFGAVLKRHGRLEVTCIRGQGLSAHGGPPYPPERIL
ncbi:MAG: hypothetical protein D6815_01290 [Candidatus Dadabacteria bacterium]|nr:MAG: hypothetical protein D6815_01290 [Candidatus Dadabacteria bacterium]